MTTYVVLAPDLAARDPWAAARGLGTVAAADLRTARTLAGAGWACWARHHGRVLRVWRASVCRRGVLLEALAADGARLLRRGRRRPE